LVKDILKYSAEDLLTEVIIPNGWATDKVVTKNISLLHTRLVTDEIIKEPRGGAHHDREMMFDTVRKVILDAYKELKKLPADRLVEKRMDKYLNMGVYKE